MNHKVGIWIDHKKAVIVSASAGQVSTKTVESNVEPHDGSQAGRGEKSFDGRFHEQLRRYYDDVIREVGQPEALLIFGPGEAKLELKERLGHTKALVDRVVGVETTDKLTDAQLVAYVKDHYGLERGDGVPLSH
ncbi:MAG: hypothetical protein ACKVU1_02815 [bacterium]